MPKDKAEFIPFNAINEFMRSDFRAHILLAVFQNLERQPESVRGPLNQLVRKYVQIPGFRNSSQAPAVLKARSSVAAFEKNAAFAAHVIQAWSGLHPDLAETMFACLTSLGWTILPVDADRTRLPGFLTTWPKGQDFSSLNNEYQKQQPQNTSSQDDISLMAVWLSGRLPINEEVDMNPSNGEDTK